MKDRRLNSNGEIEEWERPGTIPDDFIYDPDTDSYYAPGTPAEFDFEAWRREFRKSLDEIRREPPVPSKRIRIHAGVLNVPASKRKSLGSEPERPLFAGLVDDDPSAEEHPPMPNGPGREESADDPL